MDILLIAVAIFGRFLLVWRRESLNGYFGPPGSEPGIFQYALGSFLVGALGFIAQWGSAVVLVASGDLYAAVLALLLAFLVAHPLFRLAFGTSKQSQNTRPPSHGLSSPDGETPVGKTPTDLASQSVIRSEPALNYGLGALHGGISAEEAIQIMLGACNNPETMYITERWITPLLARLRSGLSNPITEDQAQALLDAVLQRCPFKDVLLWLEGEPLAWKDYQIRKRASEAEAKRLRAEKIRTNWDWEKAKRLQQAGFHVHVPPEVLLRDKERKDSKPDVSQK